MEAKELRDAVIRTLRKNQNLAVAELNGNYFSGADIAVNDAGGAHKIFRLVVIEHNQQKSFT